MDVVTAFAFVIALLLLGRGLMWRRLVPEQAPYALNQVVLYVCLPASVLLYAPKLVFEPHLLALVLLPWLLTAIGALALWLAATMLRWSEAVTGVLLLAVLGNTSFLGYPLIAALLGEPALPYAVIYDQLGSFLLLSTYGLVVLARFAHGRPPRWREIALRVLRFPPFLALVLALAVMPAVYPSGVETVLKRLADALLPLVTLAIGMQLRLRLPREQVGPLAIGLTAKLLALPLLAWCLAQVLGIAPEIRAVLVLQSAMPTMITAMALAASAGLAPELAAALVGYGTVLSMLTLPLWRALS
jgi:hypothetical protein